MSKQAQTKERKAKNGKEKTLFQIYNEYLERYPLLINGTQGVLISTAAIITSTYLTTILTGMKEHTNNQDPSPFITIQYNSFLVELNSLLSQEKKIIFPWQEIYIMGIINFFFITPALYGFNDFLGKLNAYLSSPSTQVKKADKKKEKGEEREKSDEPKKKDKGWTATELLWLSLFLDQFIFSPIFNAAVISFRHYGYYGVNEWAYVQDVLFPLLKEILPSALIYAWCFWIPVKYFMFTSVPAVYQLLVGSCFSFIWNIIFTIIEVRNTWWT